MRSLYAFLLLFLTVGSVQAATIIDLKGRTDSVLSPVVLALSAGQYSVTPISAADGAVYTGVSYWASSNCVNPAGCPQTSPTTNTGFMYKYDVNSDGIIAASVGGSALVPLASGPPVGDIFGNYWENSASDNFVRISEGIVYPTQAQAFASAQAMTFTLGAASNVEFGIFDTLPSDNRGGISLMLAALSTPPPPSTIPVPPSLPMSLAGLLIFAGLRTRRD